MIFFVIIATWTVVGSKWNNSEPIQFLSDRVSEIFTEFKYLSSEAYSKFSHMSFLKKIKLGDSICNSDGSKNLNNLNDAKLTLSECMTQLQETLLTSGLAITETQWFDLYSIFAFKENWKSDSLFTTDPGYEYARILNNMGFVKIVTHFINHVLRDNIERGISFRPDYDLKRMYFVLAVNSLNHFNKYFTGESTNAVKRFGKKLKITSTLSLITDDDTREEYSYYLKNIYPTIKTQCIKNVTYKSLQFILYKIDTQLKQINERIQREENAMIMFREEEQEKEDILNFIDDDESLDEKDEIDAEGWKDLHDFYRENGLMDDSEVFDHQNSGNDIDLIGGGKRAKTHCKDYIFFGMENLINSIQSEYSRLEGLNLKKKEIDDVLNGLYREEEFLLELYTYLFKLGSVYELQEALVDFMNFYEEDSPEYQNARHIVECREKTEKF